MHLIKKGEGGGEGGERGGRRGEREGGGVCVCNDTEMRVCE